VRQLRDEQRLITVVGRAEALDAEAFRELLNLAQGTNEFASLAEAMVRNVRRTLLRDRSADAYDVPLRSLGEQKYGGPFTSEELASQLADRVGVAVGAVNVIGNEKRTMFVPDLVELAHTSKDLWLLNRVSLALERMVGVQYSPWDLQPLDHWWSNHKASYTNWPGSEYAAADASFRACKYDAALKLFESVLAIDPKADKSRAFAVACAAEVGDIRKANQLNSSYDQKDGRWELWAAGKMLLTTGAVEQATRAFASLVEKYPVMAGDGFFERSNHFLRNLDWPLFSQLVAGSTNAAPKKAEATR
jgi:tetratricopeptide (TPR) repeat protein